MTTTNDTTGADTRHDEALYTRQIDDVLFQIDGAGALAYVDRRDGDEARLVALDKRQTGALLLFWSEIVFAAARHVRKEEQAEQQSLIARLDAALTQSREESYPHIAADVLVAPNCSADSLNQPPRVRRDADGFQLLEVKGTEGWHAEGVVEEVTRLGAHGGLVLVATDSAVYLMTAQDFDNPAE